MKGRTHARVLFPALSHAPKVNCMPRLGPFHSATSCSEGKYSNIGGAGRLNIGGLQYSLEMVSYRSMTPE